MNNAETVISSHTDPVIQRSDPGFLQVRSGSGVARGPDLGLLEVRIRHLVAGPPNLFISLAQQANGPNVSKNGPLIDFLLLCACIWDSLI